MYALGTNQLRRSSQSGSQVVLATVQEDFQRRQSLASQLAEPILNNDRDQKQRPNSNIANLDSKQVVGQ